MTICSTKILPITIVNCVTCSLNPTRNAANDFCAKPVLDIEVWRWTALGIPLTGYLKGASIPAYHKVGHLLLFDFFTATTNFYSFCHSVNLITLKINLNLRKKSFELSSKMTFCTFQNASVTCEILYFHMF